MYANGWEKFSVSSNSNHIDCSTIIHAIEQKTLIKSHLDPFTQSGEEK